MAQLHKIEIQTEIKSHPSKFYDIYKNKSHLMPKISPEKLRSIKVLEGDGTSVGSVRLWTYVMGIPVIAKDKIVGVDEDNRSISFELIGGEVTQYFNNFIATLETYFQNDNKIIKWSLQYQKTSADVPDPYSHLQFLIAMAKEIDDYLVRTYLDIYKIK